MGEEIIVVKERISIETLEELARARFGDLIKAVVDVEKKIMAIGGELHADEEATLIQTGSKQGNLWGINIYPHKPKNEWIEFDSVINIRPSQGNRSRSVEDQARREKIIQMVEHLLPE